MADPTFNPASKEIGLSNVGNYAALAFADIDADGDLDVFIGNGAGDMTFYRNQGTNVNPVFAAPSTSLFRFYQPRFIC